MKDRKNFIRTIIWTLLILLAIGLASYKTHLNQERRYNFREHKQLLDFAMAMGQEVKRSISIAWQQGMPIEDFTKIFGEVIPEINKSSGKPAEIGYIYYHPQSQRSFNLRFEDGTLQGYSSSHGYDDINTTVILESPAYLLSENVRGLIVIFSCISWMVVLILILVKPEYRPKLAMSLLFLAVICFLCWFLAGNYSPTWRGIRSNDFLAIGAFMLLLSLRIQGVKHKTIKPNPNIGLQVDACARRSSAHIL